MMTADQPYFLTTPIYYVNDLPHLGHAYTTVACDVLARFMRLDGRRVKFLTGSDEHGQKVEQSARAAGIPPEEFCDRISPAWQDRLLAVYDANPEAVAPRSRRNEVISFVKGGLKDLSISRTSFTWGVPVPGHPGHIVYVWFDALINYLSAVGYPDTDGEFTA